MSDELGGRGAHAKPTPNMTGSRLMSLRLEMRCLSTRTDMEMMKSGADARTT